MSHTTTGEWQSFELRMRRRRAQRLLLRAEIAAEAGCVEDARACLAEARRLAPGLAGIAAVETRLSHPLVPAATPRGRWLGVAAAVLAVSAVAAWSAQSHEIATAPDVRARQVTAPPARTIDIAVVPPPAHVQTPPAGAGVVEATAGRTPAPAAVAPGARDTPAGTMRTAVDRVTERMLAPAWLPAPIQIPDPPNAGSGPTIPAAGDIAEVAAAVDALPLGPLPGAAVSTPASPAPGPSAVRTAETAVRGVLDRYAAAYDALDAAAASRAWPRVNRAALTRTFDALASQHVALGDCRINVSGARALATCDGLATSVPKAGGAPRTEPRRWTFDLARAGEDWQILDARARNR